MDMHETGLGVVDPAHPELQDVLQRPDALLTVTVPVKHEGPLATQELPAVLGTIFQVTATTDPQVLLSASKMRKRATIISSDNDFLILPRRSNIGTGTYVTWPAKVPLVYGAETELSVCTSTGTATVSVITEDWAR